MARTNEKVSVRYRMRSDNVLIRITQVEKVRGLFMPEASVQGKQFIVEEVGPDVDDLKKGDVVLIKGKPGVDIGLLPNDNQLMATSQENVILVIEPESPILTDSCCQAMDKRKYPEGCLTTEPEAIHQLQKDLA